MPLLHDIIGGICVVKYIHSYQESSLDSPVSQHIATISFKDIEEKKNQMSSYKIFLCALQSQEIRSWMN